MKTNNIYQDLNLQIIYKNVPGEGKFVLCNFFFLSGCIVRRVDVTISDFSQGNLLNSLTLPFPLPSFILLLHYFSSFVLLFIQLCLLNTYFLLEFCTFWESPRRWVNKKIAERKDSLWAEITRYNPDANE